MEASGLKSFCSVFGWVVCQFPVAPGTPPRWQEGPQPFAIVPCAELSGISRDPKLYTNFRL